MPAAGVQTLNVWMREDGVQVDDIRVAKSISYDPRTVAPPTNVAPVIASLTATPNPIVVGDDVTLTATGVQDPDGTVASVTFGYVDGTFGDQVIFVDTSGANGWSFTDNTFDIGGGRTYFAFATDNAGLVGNRVEVRLDTTPAPTGVFQEVGGVVTIEASDATRRTAGSGRSWVDASRADAINGEFVTVPGTGVNAGNTLSGPKLDYDINFASSGTYYVWVRMTGPDVGSDSIHVGLNGQASTLGSFGLSTNPTDTFAWTNGQSSLGRRVTITVPAAGVQTLNVWMREDGVKVDDIRVAKSINYDPRVVAAPVLVDFGDAPSGNFSSYTQDGLTFSVIESSDTFTLNGDWDAVTNRGPSIAASSDFDGRILITAENPDESFSIRGMMLQSSIRSDYFNPTAVGTTFEATFADGSSLFTGVSLPQPDSPEFRLDLADLRSLAIFIPDDGLAVSEVFYRAGFRTPAAGRAESGAVRVDFDAFDTGDYDRIEFDVDGTRMRLRTIELRAAKCC